MTAIRKLNHVAYRCRDARETAEFYTRVLGLRYAMALSEERVPSTGERSPYMHVFFEMDDGSYVAFFELPESPPMGRDPNTPAWVQHLALEVDDMDTLLAMKQRIESHGIDVIGPTDHGFIQSIYFFDPSGHRLELCCRTETPETMRRLEELAEPMLEHWAETRKPLPEAGFVHENAWKAHGEKTQG